jgi:hypothetical protein
MGPFLHPLVIQALAKFQDQTAACDDVVLPARDGGRIIRRAPGVKIPDLAPQSDEP